MYEHSLEHIFSFSGTLDPPLPVGPVPEGIRMIFPISGGEVTGPKVRGRVVPGGGDWLTTRRDGVAILDVRLTIETDDGALVYMFYGGVSDLGPDGYDKVSRGELPPRLKLRTAPRFLTAHPAYEWLNRVQGLAIGESVTADLRVGYDVYAVR